MEAFATAALAPYVDGVTTRLLKPYFVLSLRPLKSISFSKLTTIVAEQDVLYLLIHEHIDAALQVCSFSYRVSPTMTDSTQDRIEEASQPLHGSPQIVSIRSSAELLSSLSLPATQQFPVLVSLKDHSLKPFHQLVVLHDMPVEQVSAWLVAHSLPTSTELSAENFQRVMGPSPSLPGSSSRLVVLAAINTEDLSHINLVKQTAEAWHRNAHGPDDRQVVFAWMDRDRWASWLKSVYGVKKGSEPAVVIVDHGVSLVTPRALRLTCLVSSAASILRFVSGRRVHSTGAFQYIFRSRPCLERIAATQAFRKRG